MRLSEGISRWALLLSMLTPLIWLPVYYPTVVPKAVFFRVAVTLALAAWLYRWAVTGRSGADIRDPVLWGLGALVGISALSAANGSSPLYSLFGDMERMWGVAGWAHLLAFYVVARAVFDERWWRRCSRALVGVALVLALHRLGQAYWPTVTPDVPGVRGGPAGTLGNEGFLAGFIFIGVVAVGMLWRSRSTLWTKAGLTACTGGLLWTLQLTGSRAALVGGAVAMASGMVVYAFARENTALRGVTVSAVLLGGVVGLTLLLSPPVRTALGSPLGLGAASVGEAFQGAVGDRLLAWQAGLEGFLQKPFLGYGPENFGVVFDRFFDPTWYEFTGDQPWDRAHNAFLEPFVTMGLLGGLAYVSLWGGALWTLYDGWRENRLTAVEFAAWVGLVTGYAAFLFFWFEDLSGMLFFLLLLGWGIYRGRSDRPNKDRASPLVTGSWSRWLLGGLLGFGVVAAVTFQANYLRSGREAYVATEAENVRDASEHYERALAHRAPGEIAVATAFAELVSGLPPKIRALPQGERPVKMLRRAARSSRRAMSAVVEENPDKSRLRIRYAGVLLTSSVVEQEKKYLRRAIEETERAIRAAPNRVTYYHTLAGLYDLWGSPKSVLTAALEARRLYGKMPETYVHLARGHHGMGEEKQAYRALFEAVRRGASLSDSTLAEGILRATPDSGRPARRDSLCSYLKEGDLSFCRKQ